MPTDTSQAATTRIVRDPQEIAAQLAALIAAAHRQIAIFQPQLDPSLFNNSAIARALASFVATHRHNHVRLLVEDAGQTVRDNGRIVGLCRQLSDFIRMHGVSEEHRGIREMFVIADRDGYLHQSDLARPECVADLHDRQHANQLAQRFERMWQRSEPIPTIRTAGL